MQMFEASLQWRLVQLGDSQQLKTPRQIVAYMLGAFADCATEQSLWLIHFSVNRWVIGRTCLKVGPLVTACPHLRDVLRIAILADARGIAVVRGREQLQRTRGARARDDARSTAARDVQLACTGRANVRGNKIVWRRSGEHETSYWRRRGN